MSGQSRQSGSAKPVILSTRRQKEGKAQPVIVVDSANHIEGGKAQPVFQVDADYVAKNGLISGAAVSVIASSNRGIEAGRAIPVYPISGSLSPVPPLPPSFPGFLDDIANLAAVYSVRRTLGSYTGSLLRLRRSSDNAEIDVDADVNGDLDKAAAAVWLGGATGFFTTWYEQVNAIDAIEATANEQFTYDGALANFNNRPGIKSTNSNSRLLATLNLAQSDSVILVGRLTHTADTRFLFDGAAIGFRQAIHHPAVTPWSYFAGNVVNSATAFDQNAHVFAAIYNGASSNLWLDGVSIAGGNPGSDTLVQLVIGNVRSQDDSDVEECEFVFLSAAISVADRQTIENSMSVYFGTP